jgi:hypothetical protein
MGPARDRHTIKELIGNDLTQPGDALLPFQSQAQELAGRFPKRSHGQGSGYKFLHRAARRRF